MSYRWSVWGNEAVKRLALTAQHTARYMNTACLRSRNMLDAISECKHCMMQESPLFIFVLTADTEL